MIFVLLAALAVGVACYFGIDALGTEAIDHWYLSDDAVAARNLEHARSLQEYVSARGVSSRDTLAIEQWSRGLAKQDRKRRNVGLKILLFFVIVIVLAAAAGVFAYTQGYGYPTVQTVTQELFSDPSGAADKVFSADVDKDAIPAMLDPVVTDSNVTIDGVSRSMTESTVYATAKTEEGGSVQYRISMVRDGITWKVSNVELYFPSQA
jgi:hypothetical protein